MDQAVGSSKFSGAYALPHSETETASPAKKSVDNKKYLPEAGEYTERYPGHKDLSLRSTTLAPTKHDEEIHPIDLAKNIVSTVDPAFFDSIDEGSWKNMADSLKFSGIDSIEKAMAMDLRVCPPCPVFHTWVALHGTTIFNGSNTPEKLNGINYVERILKEGTELSKNDIPLFIVFSDKGLTKPQMDEMKAEFKDHDNILCISLETDLQLKFIKELEPYTSIMGMQFLDSIRIVVSNNITRTINFCIEKAKSENKTKLAQRFEKLGVNHLFYSDIDNQWLSKPPYILASHGTFSQPKISISLPLMITQDDVKAKLSDTDKELLERHISFFFETPYFDLKKSGKWSSEKAKKLFDYILSGEAESNFKYLSEQIAHISPLYKGLLKIDQGVTWDGENSCFFVAEHSKEAFLKGALKNHCKIDLHEKPSSRIADDFYNPDPYYKEAHSLVGMQLLRYYYHGCDRTWHTW